MKIGKRNINKNSPAFIVAELSANLIYWTNRTRQFQNDSKVIFSEISIPIILPRNLVQDIDTPEDWQQVELIFEAYNKTLKYGT